MDISFKYGEEKKRKKKFFDEEKNLKDQNYRKIKIKNQNIKKKF